MKLGDCTVDLDRGVIVRDGVEKHVSPLAAAVLKDFIDAGGEVVLTENLIERHWRTEVSTPNSVHKVVNELRAALGDEAKNPLYIETVPKRGYRLISGAGTPASRRLRPLYIYGLSAAALLAVVLAGYLRFSGNELKDFRQGPALARVALVPFEYLGSDIELAALALGLTEDVAAELSRSTMRIELLSDTEGTVRPDYKIIGSVGTSESSVRLTVRVVREGDGVTIWSHIYDEPYSDLASVRALHARNIARVTGNMAFHDSLPYPTNEVAKKHMQRAMQEFVTESLGLDSNWDFRIRQLELAAEADPEFWDPIRILALTYIQRQGFSISFDEAKAGADKYLARSIEMAPDECMTMYMQGQAGYSLDLNYAQSIASFEQARSLCPVLSGIIDLQLAFIYRMMGRFEEALEHAFTAQREDVAQDQVFLHNSIGGILMELGRYDEAVEQLDKAWEVSGKGSSDATMLVLLNRTRACALADEVDCANESIDIAWKRFGDRRPHWFPGLYALLGRADEARSILEEMEVQAAEEKWVLPAEAFRAYYHLGERDLALDWLSRAIDDRQYPLFGTLRSPHHFEELKGHPRFQLAMKRLKEDEIYPADE